MGVFGPVSYKEGDKVKIKTWEEMKKEFGVEARYVKCYCIFTDEMEIELNNLNVNRLLTIKSIANNGVYSETYRMEEMGWEWSDDMIKGPTEIFGPIDDRWEILDL